MVGGIGTGELLALALILMFLFGAGKLPSVMHDLGTGLRELRRGINEGDGDATR